MTSRTRSMPPTFPQLPVAAALSPINQMSRRYHYLAGAAATSCATWSSDRPSNNFTPARDPCTH
jgi:hypothetical protein